MARRYPTFAGEAIRNISRPNGNIKHDCESIMKTRPVNDIRTAGAEFLFGRASPLLVEEAERQLDLVFEKAGQVPKDLIVVHVRWGDKKQEMRLVSMASHSEGAGWAKEIPDGGRLQGEYIFGNRGSKSSRGISKTCPPEWHIYLDQYYTDMLPYRVSEYNGSSKISSQLNGRTGLVALGSLLVAMEANDFILTTASSWSRLLDELRKSVLNPRCNDYDRFTTSKE
jgi:hypothetical protein